MKTNFYILLILLVSFSSGNAQGVELTSEIVANKTISVNNDKKEATVKINKKENISKENNSLLIEVDKVKASIARNSDIRLYLNHVRNVSNINILFPKINKAIRA